MTGVTIGGYHTYRDWKLYLTDIYISPASPRTCEKTIPGRSGTLDLSTVLTGELCYENREIKMEFEFEDGDYSCMLQKKLEIENRIHGRVLKIILDDQPEYYYQGLCMVDVDKINQMVSKLEVKVNADPYKYETASSTEAWAWDTFNFRTGAIRYLKDIEVTALNNTITIPSGFAAVAPEFQVARVDTPMQVSFHDSAYALQVGRNRFPQIKVGAAEETLTFSGTGKLSVDYRGRCL